MIASEQQADSELAALLVELMRLVTQRTAGQTFQLMLETDISMPQFVTLLILQRCGPRSVSAIATKLCLSLAATSQLIDGLVRRQLVTRQEDSADRRVKMIALLPLGTEILDQLAQSRSTEVAASMALLPDELRQQAITALERIVAYLRDLPDVVRNPPAC